MRAAGVLVPLVMQAANQRELVGHLRQPRQQLADLHPRHIGPDRLERPAILHRRRRLEVEEIEVARPAVGPEEDDGEVLIDLRLLLRRCEHSGERRLQSHCQRPEIQAADFEPRSAIQGTAAALGDGNVGCMIASEMHA